MLADPNVAAYLKAIAEAEGGGYDFKYGAVKGKRNDPWRFTDFSTHPGPGAGGNTTAAGMYQITIDTWRQHGGKMGLSDFSPKTQDLIAVEMLRSIGVTDKIKAGNIADAMGPAAKSGLRYRKARVSAISTRLNLSSNMKSSLRATRPMEAKENEAQLQTNFDCRSPINSPRLLDTYRDGKSKK